MLNASRYYISHQGQKRAHKIMQRSGETAMEVETSTICFRGMDFQVNKIHRGLKPLNHLIYSRTSPLVIFSIKEFLTWILFVYCEMSFKVKLGYVGSVVYIVLNILRLRIRVNLTQYWIRSSRKSRIQQIPGPDLTVKKMDPDPTLEKQPGT